MTRKSQEIAVAALLFVFASMVEMVALRAGVNGGGLKAYYAFGGVVLGWLARQFFVGRGAD